MSTSPSPDEPDDDDKEVLTRIFGAPVSPVDPSTRLVWYIGLALIATIVFWILSSFAGPIILKAVVFFVLVLGVDLLFTDWRRNHPIYR